MIKLRYALFIFMMMLVASCATLPPPHKAQPKLPTESYVKMESYLGVMKTSWGSGVIVDDKPEGSFVLTAAHVCVMDSPLETLHVRDVKGDLRVSIIVRMDLKMDTCVVFVPELHGEEIKMAVFGPKPGDAVFSISSPFGFEGIAYGMVPVIKGTYMGNYVWKGPGLCDAYHLRIGPGSSGGMIVNSHGRLVGMTHSGLVIRGYTDFSFGPEFNRLKEFLRPYM